MNNREYLLTCLAEECMEVAQRATKAIRFGLQEIQPGQPHTNAERLTLELNDLWGVLAALRQSRIYQPVFDTDLQDAKVEKLNKFMEYSRQLGCLNDSI